MLKKPVAILLLMIILFQCSIKTIIAINFYLNRDYIAKFLCENRKKPLMNCKGKCYLKKQLEKEKKGEQPLQEFTKDKIDPVICISTDYCAVLYYKKVLGHINQYTANTSSKFSADIFHPPSAAAFIS